MSSDSFDNEGKSYSSKDGDTDSKTHKEEGQKDNKDLIQAISMILTMVLEENKNFKNYREILIKQNKLIFTAKSVPKISIFDYLVRILKYTFIERNTLIISLIYIDRLCELSKITLTYYNIHRILVGAILIAIKYNEDSIYNNKYYSDVAGVTLNELNLIESKFIELCDCKMFVPYKVFENYCYYLESFKKINHNKL
jgi:hypothetical protein